MQQKRVNQVAATNCINAVTPQDKSLILNLILLLFFHLAPANIVTSMKLTDADKDAIEKIRQMIECGIFGATSIKQLCEVAEMSKSKLMNGFFLLNKKTIYQYRLTIAMEYAKSLLEEGRSVKEISIQLGYKTSGHFSRAFTKVFCSTPGTFKSVRNA